MEFDIKGLSILDKAQAIHNFWSSFGLRAYDENTLPTNMQFPYITYNVATDSIDYNVEMTGNLWYKDNSWSEISQKAEEIAMAVECTDKRIAKIDNGYVWFKKGTPFTQRMNDPNDTQIRRMVINLTVEYLTQY